MKRRMLAVLMSLVVTVTMTPTVSFAAPEEADPIVVEAAEEEEAADVVVGEDAAEDEASPVSLDGADEPATVAATTKDVAKIGVKVGETKKFDEGTFNKNNLTADAGEDAGVTYSRTDAAAMKPAIEIKYQESEETGYDNLTGELTPGEDYQVTYKNCDNAWVASETGTNPAPQPTVEIEFLGDYRDMLGMDKVLSITYEIQPAEVPETLTLNYNSGMSVDYDGQDHSNIVDSDAYTSVADGDYTFKKGVDYTVEKDSGKNDDGISATTQNYKIKFKGNYKNNETQEWNKLTYTINKVAATSANVTLPSGLVFFNNVQESNIKTKITGAVRDELANKTIAADDISKVKYKKASDAAASYTELASGSISVEENTEYNFVIEFNSTEADFTTPAEGTLVGSFTVKTGEASMKDVWDGMTATEKTFELPYTGKDLLNSTTADNSGDGNDFEAKIKEAFGVNSSKINKIEEKDGRQIIGVGKYTVMISGADTWANSPEIEATVEVTPKNMWSYSSSWTQISDIEATATQAKNYAGNLADVTVEVLDKSSSLTADPGKSGKILKEGTDYSKEVVYRADGVTGWDVKITGMGNYKTEKTADDAAESDSNPLVTVPITTEVVQENGADISDAEAFTAEIKNIAYDGKAHEIKAEDVVVTEKSSGTVLKPQTDGSSDHDYVIKSGETCTLCGDTTNQHTKVGEHSVTIQSAGSKCVANKERVVTFRITGTDIGTKFKIDSVTAQDVDGTIPQANSLGSIVKVVGESGETVGSTNFDYKITVPDETAEEGYKEVQYDTDKWAADTVYTLHVLPKKDDSGITKGLDGELTAPIPVRMLDINDATIVYASGSAPTASLSWPGLASGTDCLSLQDLGVTSVKDKADSAALDLDKDYEFTKVTGVGTYTIVLTGKGKYAGSEKTLGTVTVTPKDISGTGVSIASAGSDNKIPYVAGKVNILPTDIKVLNGSNAMEMGKDFDVECTPETAEIGAKISVRIIGKGNYTGEKTSTNLFEIKKATLDDKNFKLEKTELGYNADIKNVSELASSIVLLDARSGEKVDAAEYTVACSGTYAIGEKIAVTVTAKTGSELYDGEAKFEITITKAKLASVEVADQAYTGSAIEPEAVVKDSDGVVVPADQYELSFKNNTKLGDATVVAIASDDGSYTGTAKGTFKIKAASIKSAKVTVKAQTWTGKALKPSVTVKLGSRTLKKNTDYTVSYTSNKNIGTAKATIKGKGNYTGSVSKTFKINPAKGTVSSAKVGSKKITVTVKKQGGAKKYEVSYRVSGTKSWKKVSSKSNKITLKKLKKGKKYQIRARVSSPSGSYGKVKTSGKVK